MKKIIAILLLVALCTSLLACEKKDDDKLPEQSTNSEQTAAPEEREDEDEDEKETSDEEIDLEEIDEKLNSYRAALDYLEKGNIEDAYDIFLSIKDYRNVNEYLERFSFKYNTKMTLHSINRSVRTNYYEYNEYGKPTLELSFFSNYSGVDSFVFEYDDNQNLLRNVHYTNGDVDDFLYYTYDEEGRPISQERKAYGTNFFEYDDKGNMTKIFTHDKVLREYMYDEEGRVLSEIEGDSSKIYEYDSQGNCISIILSYGGVTSSAVANQYDENGNLIRQQVTQSNGYSYSFEYEYDKNGNKIKDASYYPAGRFEIFYFIYDENGNMTEQRMEDQDGFYSSYSYEYDSMGNRTKETWNQRSDIKSVTTYEYDGYGNLIKKTLSGETDSPDDYYVTTYTGYKLYYNPYGTQILPPDYWTKG